MNKGHKHIPNPNGRPIGAKSKPEMHLLKTYTHAWLLALRQEGFNKLAKQHPVDALKIAASFVPKQVGFDDDTIKTLAGWLGGKE